MNVTAKSSTDVALEFNDKKIHEYIFENGTLYYIIIDTQNYNEKEKQISLCKDIDNCTFSYQNNKLTIDFKMGKIQHKNIFNI